MEDTGSIVAFWLLAALTVGSALAVVAVRDLIRAVVLLITSFLGVAGLYITLSADFVAVVQVLIYGGAIIIVLLFAIMLTRSGEYPRISDNRQWPLAVVAALGLLGVLVPAFLIRGVDDNQPHNPAFSDLANSLFTRWAIPFEVASLVLLVALIGSIIIARSGEDGP